MSKLKTFYATHIKQRMQEAQTILTTLNYQSLILGAGAPFTYFEDDMDAIFRTNPHFAHWCPAKGPHHLIKFTPGKKPLLVYYSPQDFWHSHEELNDPFWASQFDIIQEGELTKMWSHLGDLSYAAFIGSETNFPKALGLKTNCELLTARLNWHRRFKSEYEIHCLSEANRIGAKAHHVAREIFFQGGSAYEIHMSYLLSMQVSDEDLPYQAIVGLNQNAAVLHFHKKEHIKNGNVLLIDSGASFQHYGSDITRTYAVENCDPLFREILKATIQMQKELCKEIKPGLSFPSLHEQCHLKVAEILERFEILKLNGEYQKAMEDGLTKTFFPHGLGHMLGIQVHDIGGKQLDVQGNVMPLIPSNIASRNLRFVGKLEEGIVVTVEPGIYFIPMLLDKLKEDKKLSKHVNWKLIERMIPCGGIRIEDNVLVTANGHRNLTREFLD